MIAHAKGSSIKRIETFALVEQCPGCCMRISRVLSFRDHTEVLGWKMLQIFFNNVDHESQVSSFLMLM